MINKFAIKARWAAPILLLLLIAGSARVYAEPGHEARPVPQAATSQGKVTLVADPSEEIYRLPALPVPTGVREEGATFIIDYLSNVYNSGGDWCDPWPEAAQNAFETAASIWSSIIQSSIPITIEACWTDIGDSRILGYSLEPDHFSNFPGAPRSNTAYPAALANALSGSDRNGGEPEMYLAYNREFNYYFGTDGNTPQDAYDFETVVLHEMGHGLGFSGSAYENPLGSGNIYWKAPPNSFDRFTQNGSGAPLLDFSSGSSGLAQQMTSGDIYFNGPQVNAANGGAPARLYAPNPWEPGSSYSHLDDSTYDNGPNALMTHALGNGSSIHDPGPITRGMLADTGWENATPTIAGMPDQIVHLNGSAPNAIDLWALSGDRETPNSELTYEIENTPSPGAGVEMDASERYIDVLPDAGWTGQTSVTVRVTDPGGKWDHDTFTVTIARIWDGSSGSGWHTSSSWTPSGLPVGDELVLIPPVNTHPVISGSAAAVGGLIIQPGAVLDLTGQMLSVESQLTNNGTLKQTLEVNELLTTEFLRITNQAGTQVKYYGVDITPSLVASNTTVTVSIAGDQVCSPQVPGARRCYQISPSGAMDARVRFYIHEDELGGHLLMDLSAYHLSAGAWKKEAGLHQYPVVGDVKYVEVGGIDQYSPFALSEFVLDHAHYLPIIQNKYT